MDGKEGKYIYCIISTKQERNFGPIGIGSRDDEVLTIGYGQLSMVVSNYPAMKIVVNSENMLAHEKVIERVMQEFDSVLPVKFGTIAATTDEIRNLLDKRASEFKCSLREMDNKVELGVKGLWKNTKTIFKEIVEENSRIKKLKKEITESKKTGLEERMKIGEMVQKSLVEKKEMEANRVTNLLKDMAHDYKLNKTVGDEMFMNGAFLVDRAREKEFDNAMDELGVKFGKRMAFRYSGPLPVYNFVNIEIYPEELEA